MNGRLARAVLALLLVGVCGRVLSSYVLIDDKWPDGTVTLQLQLGTPRPRAERRFVELGSGRRVGAR